MSEQEEFVFLLYLSPWPIRGGQRVKSSFFSSEAFTYIYLACMNM